MENRNLTLAIPGEDRKKIPENPRLLPFPSDVPYSLTQSGTFKIGEFQINESGIRIKGRRQRGASIGNASDIRPIEYDCSQFEKLAVGEEEPEDDDQVALEELEIKNIIGKGHSGTVREVIHRPTRTKLALKSIPLEFGEDMKGKLMDEIRLLLKIKHPNVVTFHGGFLKEGTILIVLEYMKYTLGDLLSLHGKIPERFLSRIMKSVLQALFHLETVHKLVHRDIKPSNLLVNEKGETKITDFGVSTQLQSSLQKCRTWIGSVTYMSPERITGLSYDYKSDIWSLGLTLYECAIGKYPYMNFDTPSHKMGGRNLQATFWDLLDAIITQPVPLIDRMNLDPDLNDFIDCCLQKDVKKRSSASQLLTHPFITKYEADIDIDTDFVDWLTI